MVSVCFYFQVHQPPRMRQYKVFDIGNSHDYFDHKKNADILKKIEKKCYLPTNRLMLDLINKHNGKFKISYSITGLALEQMEENAPEVIKSFQDLADTGCVEFLSETYYHSLSFLFSKQEFVDQINLHKKKIKDLFGQKPTVFRNTELIFNNEMAKFIECLGYKGMLAEGADHILGWRSPSFLYKPVSTKKMNVLLKNYKMSDDIAFRFSNTGWEEHPLTVPKYVNWVNAFNGNGHVLNLFMDYETFGEHQWATTGIFKFMKHLPEEILKNPDNNFVTPSEAFAKYPHVGEIDVHNTVSWADVERDLSAWLGNKMQRYASEQLYKLREPVMKSDDAKLIEDWRKLTTSDHYYYMCTKWFADGDVHKYFNPYDSPYDGFIAFMNVLNDIQGRLATPVDDENSEKLKNKVII
jgi:alpha-amylase